LSLAGGVTWAPGPDKPFPDQVEYIEFRDSIMYLDGQIGSVYNRLSMFILHFTVRGLWDVFGVSLPLMNWE
jgi:hypothetical protein